MASRSCARPCSSAFAGRCARAIRRRSASVPVRSATFTSEPWRLSWRRMIADADACALASRARGAAGVRRSPRGGPLGIERRSAAPASRTARPGAAADACGRPAGCCRRSAPPRAEDAVAELQRLGAAGAEHLEPRPVGVVGAALAREPGERPGDLLVDRAVRRERLVDELVVAPRHEHLVGAARQRPQLRQHPGVSFATSVSGGVAERRLRARPRSSSSCTRPRSCLTSGSVASTVGPSERMPGRAPRAKRRTSGNAALSASSVGGAARSVRGSSPTAADSALSRSASAPAVVLKSATSARRRAGSASSAPATTPWSRIQSPRSRGRLPSSASETIAENL